VQIPDVLADAAYSTPALVRMLTHRSVVAVPFLREGHPIGGIAVGRAHPGPFPETQIRLLQSFADQAVIAIENTRLFEAEQARTRELSEALEQQIATSKVLEIISSSTGDLQHVLATLLENATRLCQANFGNLFLREESQFFRLVATHNAPPQWAAWWQRTPVVHPHPRSPLGRAVNKEIVHVVDLASEQPYIERDPTFVALVDLAGARAIVSVPMLKDGEVLGVVAIYSQEPRPFTAKQIELLKTFADQAVIASENTRLFEEVQARTHELQESLEYQTATNDILNVISRSQSKLQPVLDAIVNTATRLCQADYAFIWKLEGSLFQLAAMNGIDADFAAFAQANLPVFWIAVPRQADAFWRSVLSISRMFLLILNTAGMEMRVSG